MPGIGMNSIKNWPAQSREAARRVIEQYGEPDEISDGQLVWHKRGPWRQIVASKASEQANFPAPHYTLFALEPSEELSDHGRGKGDQAQGTQKCRRAWQNRRRAAGNLCSLIFPSPASRRRFFILFFIARDFLDVCFHPFCLRRVLRRRDVFFGAFDEGKGFADF